MLYILHGENALQQEEALATIVAQLDIPPELRDLNTAVLTAPLTIGDLRRACSAIPFLGGARLVIVRDGLSRDRGSLTDEIVAYLPDLPPTTVLIFIESQKLAQRHGVLKYAQKVGSQIQECVLPAAKALPGWIQERTKQRGGRIEPAAAALLAQNLGANLRLLDQEIQKLLLYVLATKTITVVDVQVMVPYIQSADVIFNLVDALGQRNARNAAGFLHRLLEVGEHPLGIFGMIVRQFRLLLQVRWLSDRHQSEAEIAARLKLHPFVTQKVRAQAGHFTPAQLREAYTMLLTSDLAIKSGEVPPETALDLLIAELTGL